MGRALRRRTPQPEPPAGEQETGDERRIRQEILNLTITDRAKDMHIAQLYKEQKDFTLERQGYVEKLMTFNRKVGELETRLLQLSAPSGNVPNASEMTSRLEAGAESALLVSPSEQFGS